ncbi:glycosyltransferase family 2 protein [Qiania dongpingensis]|uniref:Glycosyltransferase family 2 protein n=1 Tax=Qiania dongpingensis TaxID=2763669 RepID=A0A7G9G7R5_9FIRM|nr:glycosyltransferase family 2 protein [Qiania dongpingensis]QNM06847.1 glycosyltransferase family 2 protein [Qiania dongpingensis]
MEKVTIIIPNYNGKKFMEGCMAALEGQAGLDFKVLLVDNGSADGSLEYIREHYPELEVIALDKNYGFSRAVNEGIRAAETPYVILLNNDTKVRPGYVAALVRMMDEHPEAFSASARMIQMHHPELLDDAGDQYTILGWAFQRGVAHSTKRYRKPARVFSACAGAAIYRRSVFEKIGYFDEKHFAYLEDLDVGYRARIHGWQNLYCPDAEVEHVGSGTSGSKYNKFKVRLAARNNVYLNYKNMPVLQFALNFPTLLIGCLIKMRFFKKRGFGEDYKEGLLEGWSTRKECRKVPFSFRHLWNYFCIQARLAAGTFIYAYEFLHRKLIKPAEK